MDYVGSPPPTVLLRHAGSVPVSNKGTRVLNLDLPIALYKSA